MTKPSAPPAPLDLDALKEVATNATPGEWRHGYEDGSGKGEDNEGHYIIYDRAEPEGSEGEDAVVVGGSHYGVPVGVESKADATFIATFDPPTVLALLERLQKAEELVDALREQMRPLSWHYVNCDASVPAEPSR